jgi:hypothetical protein
VPEVTEIREPNFSLDLPGEWEQGESADAPTLVFREVAGPASVSVTLLGVRPMFEIADKFRLLEDYMSHRQKYEGGKTSVLVHSQPTAMQLGDGFEGEWSSEDPGEGRLVQHRVMLRGSLLADFAFEAAGLGESAFAAQAAAVLGSASASE